MATLSIAILNWNGAEYLEDCLASVPKSIEAERILIDNASTDDSWKIAEKYGFRVVHANNEHRFLTGINTALREAWGDYILFSQGDVRFGAEAVRYLFQAAKRNPYSIIQPVFYKGMKIDNAGMKWVWPGYGIGNLRVERTNEYPTDICTSISFIISRKVLDTVGFYDEAYSPAYMEDVDWFLRSKKLGVSHLVLGKAYVYHRHNESFSTLYRKKEISDICRRNRRYLIKKNYRGFDRLLRLSVSSCLDIVKKSFDVIRDWWIAAHNRH